MHTGPEMSLAAANGVDTPSRGERTRDFWLPWTFRRILGLPGSPLAICAVAVLLSLAMETAIFNASGLWQGFRMEAARRDEARSRTPGIAFDLGTKLLTPGAVRSATRRVAILRALGYLLPRH